MSDNIFILCGGFGTRLKSVVSDVPKPMAPILNKPFLYYQIKEIRKYFPNTSIYLLTYHMSEIIDDYFKDDNLIKIIKEKTPLGTGGSIKHAINYLNLALSSSLIVFNGDTYIRPNLIDMILSDYADIIMLCSYQSDCSRYGTVRIKNNLIVSFNEKVDHSENMHINAGCYYFQDLDFFYKIQKNVFAIEDEFQNYLDNYGKIAAYEYDDIFIDIGIPKDYLKMIDYIGENDE